MKKLYGLILGCLMLAGCATGFGIAGMSPEQLAEYAKMKDASAMCVKGVYAGVSVTTTAVNIDKGIPSGMTVKDSCEISFSSPPK
jgi:outer membrane lipoprotein-sorting protein